jgi:hypothetical protein
MPQGRTGGTAATSGGAPPSLLPALLAAVLAAAPGAAAAADPPPASIEWHAGRLSVEAQQAPLRELLAALATLTGVEMWGIETLHGRATVSFAELPLRDGLRILLAPLGYGFIEAEAEQGGPPGMVVVVGSRAEAGSPVDESLPGAEANAEQGERGDVEPSGATQALADAVARSLSLQRLAREDAAAAQAAAAEAARSAHATERALAVQVLGGITGAAATDALAAALADPDPSVRQAALVGLIGRSEPAATQLLAQALADEAASVRFLARELLTQRGAIAAAGDRDTPEGTPPGAR